MSSDSNSLKEVKKQKPVNEKVELVQKYLNGDYKSQLDFCTAEGIPPTTFAGWKREYNNDKLYVIVDGEIKKRKRSRAKGSDEYDLNDYSNGRARKFVDGEIVTELAVRGSIDYLAQYAEQIKSEHIRALVRKLDNEIKAERAARARK